MATNNSIFEKHTFKSFLSRYHVVIPMVQRDYAQGRTTDDVNRVRTRFLNAIKPYLIPETMPAKVMKLDFVYGEVEKVWSTEDAKKLDKIVITPLDGQQRLTTLFLLHWYASKKDGIQEINYAFLNNFTYEIRPSSRDFCKHLISYFPDLSKSLEAQIKDQNWFMAEWGQDPTIISMLVMLDAIKEVFHDVHGLWQKLTGNDERIVFYFLPLSENGLSDKLYIKMNSRGKKLTQFEHFKAEYEALYERDSVESIQVNHKFDVEWVDAFFPYRDKDDTVDREFMRYFFYVSHILCYQQSVKKSNDEFELIKLLYDEKGTNPKAKENKLFLEKAYDCWYSVLKGYGSIDAFFTNYLSHKSYEKGKVATYKSLIEYNNTQNYFKACIKLYQVNTNFSYSDFLFLFGILTYLLNKDTISESNFIVRLRTLRNLVMNSNAGEIRGDADYMKDLLEEVDTLIQTGEFAKDLTHRLNITQEQEEIEKREKKEHLNDKDKELLLKFEDHPLIYGYVSALGYDNLHLVDTFYSLFNNPDYLVIHRAMISIDDYRQNDGSRYFMGNSNRSTWMQLLHRSRAREGSELNTRKVLIALLQRISNGETLDSVIESYLAEQERNSSFDWRYYFAKYGHMLRGADGELVWGDNTYLITTLNKHQFNGKHWNPFLNVIAETIKASFKGKIKKEVVSLGDYGENLIVHTPISSLSSTRDGYVYFHGADQDDWKVNQKDGIDTEDRVEMAINKLSSLIQRALEN